MDAPKTHAGPGSWKDDLLASLVVFMVALPLCIAIASACGVPPELGIITGIVGGLIVGPLSGSPLQVSGPAAGLIVLMIDFLRERAELTHANPETPSPLVALGVMVFLAGLMQIAMAALRFGPYFRAVSPAVILGMLAGIGVVIFAKQFHVMADRKASDEVVHNLRDIPKTIQEGLLGTENPNAQSAFLLALGTLVILFVWKKVAPKKLKLIPAALLAVVIASTAAYLAELPVQKIQVQANLFDSIQWLTLANLSKLVQDPGIWQMAFAVALIASAETLLCATAVDAMQSGPRTNYNRELFAQGVGNTLCGIMGSLPMTGVIVRSSANIEAGAKTRLSATLHGLWLLILVVGLPSLLRTIPAACLAAILVYTGIKLVNIHEAKKLWRESRSEALIFVATLLGVVMMDLLKGVILGIVLAALKLLYTFSHLDIHRIDNAEESRTDLHLNGSATFLRLPQLAAELDKVPKGWTLHLYVEDLAMIDHACLVLLTDWEKQHRATGGDMVFDRETLLAKFDAPPNRERKEPTVEMEMSR